jgi:lipopolysaccharide/colanic/teichoic acid biosynthesis glycosyltransferase
VIKRLFDAVVSLFGLLVASPLLFVAALAIWLQDFHSPLYLGLRTGRKGRPFRMVKFRSMIVRADRTGVDSTAGDDTRITAVGKLVRRFKLDELPQLWNVLLGQMSLVGPRPNVPRETDLYTAEERRLLDVAPGVTDIASIVFADESEILRGSDDPDLRYHQLIRPWKSRLALLGVAAPPSLTHDLEVIWLTALSAVSRPAALRGCASLVRRLGGDEGLARVAQRTATLVAAPPPGASQVVQSRVA